MEDKKIILAVIWDFDKTLIPGNMQDPLFKKYNVNSHIFWNEVDNLYKHYFLQGKRINQETIYLNHILTYVNEGIFKNLNTKLLKELGKEIGFNPGLPYFFSYLKEQISKEFGNLFLVENYIVSTGIRVMIEGSSIYRYIEGCWGSEFIEDYALPNYNIKNSHSNKTQSIQQIGYAFDNISKIKAIIEINKGINNQFINNKKIIAKNEQRVDFNNMIYIADGESDIPAFLFLKEKGGSTYGVYPRDNSVVKEVVQNLYKENLLEKYGEANYEIGSSTADWVLNKLREMALRNLNNQNSI